MDIVQTKSFDRSKQKQTTTVPTVRGADTAPYAFQWLLYKPQLHAIEPFQINEPARCGNNVRSIPSADGK
jgi:hypothetical protein